MNIFHKLVIILAMIVVSGDSRNPVAAENAEQLLKNTTAHITNLVIKLSEPIREVPIVYLPFQVTLLGLILIVAIYANGLLIVNISCDSIKRQMLHFLLIRHMCVADLIGALLIIPIPLISFMKGNFDWGNTACSIISTTTSCSWTMHFITVMLYRIDRLLASWLSIGRYPILKPTFVKYFMIFAWILSLSGSFLGTQTFTAQYHPALVLCIPKFPPIFFILVFTTYLLGLAAFVTVNVVRFLCKRCSQQQLESNEIEGINLEEFNINDYHSSKNDGTFTSNFKEKETWWTTASNLISVGHIVLYLPAMMAIAMIGEKLSAPIAFLCGVIVYIEVTIQPIAILLLSSRLRNEVISGM